MFYKLMKLHRIRITGKGTQGKQMCPSINSFHLGWGGVFLVVFFLFNSLVFNRENVREETRTSPKMSRESSPPQHSVLFIHLHL